MKPIIGQTTYKEFSPEEIARYMHEAEMRRAEAVRDSFFAAYAGLKAATLAIARLIHGNHGAKAAGAR